MLDDLDLPGWDRDDGDSHVTFIRSDRLAKVTVKPIGFAFGNSGWKADLWVKETPHGRSQFEDSVVDDDADRFVAALEGLIAR